MQTMNTHESWGWIARLLHWAIAGVILFQLGWGIYMSEFVSDVFRQFELVQVHKSWGFIAFALASVRLVWRIANRKTPEMPAGTPAWQEWVSSITHKLLYLLMFALPLSGWIMSSASPNQEMLKIENMVFDWFAMPDPFVPGVKSVAEAAAEFHQIAAYTLIGLLLLHVGAALKHLVIERDTIFQRMTWGR
ncbi:cytochrome b [Amaricoccus macauensis]|uniref:cytochrome b n=1 Tax=Amaricoccus macauensis TaxID=57001 RepID=UPI003C7B13B5